MGFSQTNIYRFNPKISFDKPDTSVWILNMDKLPDKESKGLISYLRKPVYDSLGRSIRPMMAIVFENLKDSIDAVAYSANYWFGNNPYHVKYNLLGGYPDYSSDRFAVMFDGVYYRSGVKHKVMMGFIVRYKIGIQIICDSVDDVFLQVESDMKKFIKSVHIEEVK